MQPSWERHSVQAAQGTLHVSPKRIPAGGPRPLHPHHDLGLRQAPGGGVDKLLSLLEPLFLLLSSSSLN